LSDPDTEALGPHQVIGQTAGVGRVQIIGILGIIRWPGITSSLTQQTEREDTGLIPVRVKRRDAIGFEEGAKIRAPDSMRGITR